MLGEWMMSLTHIKKVLLFICIVFLFLPPIPVNGLGLVSLHEVPPDFEFPPVTLNGTNQSVSGGSGRVVINQALSLNLIEQWEVTVQASPLKQVGGSGQELPLYSFKLNKPISHDNRVTIPGGPWEIDVDSPVTIIQGKTSLGLLTQYIVDFGQNPFTIQLDPGFKLLDPGQSSTKYETTITWTLTNPVL